MKSFKFIGECEFVLVLVFSSGVLLSGCGRPIGDPVVVKENIQQSLQAHEKAESLHEWQGSLHHPLYLEKSGAVPLETDQGKKIACDVLGGLSEEDLLVFLAHWYSQLEALCAEELDAKARAHLQKVMARTEHDDDVKIRAYKSEGLAETVDSAEGFSESSRIIEVDTARVHRLVDGRDVGIGNKEVFFTFDDGPHPRYTQRILQALDQHDVKALFLVVGQRVRRNARTLQATADAGHEVANHTFTHPDMRKLSVSRMKSELRKTDDAIRSVLGFVSQFFRFPYGAENNRAREVIRNAKLTALHWNMDTLDWKIKNPAKLYQRVIGQLKRQGRGIILFHDIQPQTATVLPRVLKYMKNNGYKTVILKDRDRAGSARLP